MEIEFTVGTQSVVLTDYGRLKDGRMGDLAPQTTLETWRVGGQLVKSAYRQEKRALDLPFLFKAATETALLANVQTILSVLSAGEGTLRVTRNDGTVRELYRCYYVAGLGEKGWLKVAEAVLSFDALDPYWYSTVPTIEVFASGSVVSFFPFFPLLLTSSSIVERKTINNPGLIAWPFWSIYGPGLNPSIINHTTGEQLTLNCSLSASDILTIDTSPLAKTVQINGANAYQYLTAASVLFGLLPGDNDISVQMNIITAGISAGSAMYYPRYISP